MIENYIVLAAPSPYYAFQNSDGIGQLIVGLLLLGSIITWSIMLEKVFSLFRTKAASEDFLHLFRGRKALFSVYKKASQNPGAVSSVYMEGYNKLAYFYNIEQSEISALSERSDFESKLSSSELESVRNSLEKSVSDNILILEEKMGVLATAVSVSPFFGLFGTVWGVMMAFCGVAAKGQADISALAPGVSGALLTTVVGLLVAIPSLIGYNLLTVTIRKVTIYMDNFVEEFMAELKLEQIKFDK